MSNSLEHIRNMTVADVMSRHVVTISANASMGDAAQILCRHQISGAPVVDEMGRCIGVLSTSDFVIGNRKQRPDTDHSSDGDKNHTVIQNSPETPMHIELIREDCVREHMQGAVQTVEEKTPILDAARCMHSEQIHRLIVLDETHRPAGIVSSLDLIGAFVEGPTSTS